MQPRQTWASRRTILLAKYPVVEYIHHELYDSKKFAAQMMNKPDWFATFSHSHSGFSDTSLANLCNHTILTKSQEVFLFQQLNFFRHKANTLRLVIENCGIGHTKRQANIFEHAHARALLARNLLFTTNIRLIVNFLKKKPNCATRIFELISDASLIALRCIDKYDWSRGFKFSTYLTWSLTKSLKWWENKEDPEHIISGKHQLHRHAQPYLEEIPDYREYCEEISVDKLLEQAEQFGPRHKRYIYILKCNRGIGCQRESFRDIGKRLHISTTRAQQLAAMGMDCLKRLTSSN